MPLRETRQRFTKSEMFILGWRSMEQQAQMQKRLGKTPQLPSYSATESRSGKFRKDIGAAQIPANLPDKFFNEEGSVDLSQVTGAEAVKYLNLLGIHVPAGGGVYKEGFGPEDVAPTRETLSKEEVADILGKIKG